MTVTNYAILYFNYRERQREKEFNLNRNNFLKANYNFKKLYNLPF